VSGLAVAVMVAVCGVVWGGFAVLLALALRREGGRRSAGGDPSPSGEPGA
jgi:hypothetical protein